MVEFRLGAICCLWSWVVCAQPALWVCPLLTLLPLFVARCLFESVGFRLPLIWILWPSFAFEDVFFCHFWFGICCSFVRVQVSFVFSLLRGDSVHLGGRSWSCLCSASGVPLFQFVTHHAWVVAWSCVQGPWGPVLLGFYEFRSSAWLLQRSICVLLLVRCEIYWLGQAFWCGLLWGYSCVL